MTARKPRRHTCLGCGSLIEEGCPEVEVPGAAYGVRYRHASDEDCAAALRGGSRNIARIGAYRDTRPR